MFIEFLRNYSLTLILCFIYLISIYILVHEIRRIKKELATTHHSLTNFQRNINKDILNIKQDVSKNDKQLMNFKNDKEELRRNTTSIGYSLSEWKDEIIKYINQIFPQTKGDLKNYVNKELSHYNTIINNLRNKINEQEHKIYSLNRELQELKNEVKKINILENEIKELKNKFEIQGTQTQKLINNKKEEESNNNFKIQSSTSSIFKTNRLDQAHEDKFKREENIDNKDKAYINDTTILLNEDINSNEKVLNRFIEQGYELKYSIETTIKNSEDKENYIKLINKSITQFETLLVKFNNNSYDSGVLANKIQKILKQTIIKGISQIELKKSIITYMQKCGVRQLNWKVGKKLEDEDYEYIDEPIIQDKVTSPLQNNTITAIEQEAFIIDYLEDNKSYEVIIPGRYHVGKYE